jgi:tRNA pseudouridine38-40 synthase
MTGVWLVKYALGVEYSGTAYCGWQRQPHCDSVQQNLESALGFVADSHIDLVCAGRTDSGVHAVEQVAHFETGIERNQRSWIAGSNCRMPRDIRLKWVVPVAQDFNARFSANARSYRYIICNSAVPSAIFHDRTSWEFRPLDHNLMHDCAQILVGEHDFSSFRAAGCQSRSPNRNIHQISVSRQGEMIYLDVTANAFLYHMVRNIAGSLIAIGRGDRDSAWLSQIFRACDRNLAAATATASGLYLLKAWYETKYKLPQLIKKPVLF